MSIYIGVNGIAKKVKQAYIGVNGNAQVIYKTGVVPDGYIPVEYIYNDHDTTNSIDTSIKPNTYTRIICKMAFGPNQTTDTYDRNIIYNYGADMSIYEDNQTEYRLGIRVGSQSIIEVVSESSPFEIDLNRSANKDSYFNNTLIFNNTNTYTSSYSLVLFRDANLRDIRIYSCAIYESMLNGVLSRNYIPCIRISDGTVGMWESVTQTFYSGSNSTDHYSSGPVITS